MQYLFAYLCFTRKGKLDESITRETRFMPQTKAATEAYRSIIDDTQLGLLQLLSKNRPHDANKVYEVAERKVTDAIYKTLASSNVLSFTPFNANASTE